MVAFSAEYRKAFLAGIRDHNWPFRRVGMVGVCVDPMRPLSSQGHLRHHCHGRLWRLNDHGYRLRVSAGSVRLHAESGEGRGGSGAGGSNIGSQRQCGVVCSTPYADLSVSMVHRDA